MSKASNWWTSYGSMAAITTKMYAMQHEINAQLPCSRPNQQVSIQNNKNTHNKQYLWHPHSYIDVLSEDYLPNHPALVMIDVCIGHIIHALYRLLIFLCDSLVGQKPLFYMSCNNHWPTSLCYKGYVNSKWSHHMKCAATSSLVSSFPHAEPYCRCNHPSCASEGTDYNWLIVV